MKSKDFSEKNKRTEFILNDTEGAQVFGQLLSL